MKPKNQAHASDSNCMRPSEYIAARRAADQPLTLAGLASYVGIDVADIMRRCAAADDGAESVELRAAVRHCRAYLEERLISGQTGQMFLARLYGFDDYLTPPEGEDGEHDYTRRIKRLLESASDEQRAEWGVGKGGGRGA